MPESPHPIRLPGEPALPAEPYGRPRRAVPADELDLFGAESAAASLAARIERVRGRPVQLSRDGRERLSPPFDRDRDHVDGPPYAERVLVLFGAYGTAWSEPLAELIAHVRERHVTTVQIAWRHFPDPGAHPHAVVFALAAEAAAERGRFWVLTRELLRLRHDDPEDLRRALVRAGLDPARTLAAMRAGTGADHVVDDAASAFASGVAAAPALFIDGGRYAGELTPAAIDRELLARTARP